MKKKLLSLLCGVTMLAAALTGCGNQSADTPASSEGETTEAPAASSEGGKIALITMDSIDQHWISLNEGAQKAAGELGVEVTFMSPNTKDDAQQIECVNNASIASFSAEEIASGPFAATIIAL